MDSFATYILTAFALVFVIEGLLYALFPDAVKRMMAIATAMPPEKLRGFGLMMVVTGMFFIWLITKF